jgi:CDP-diacylglycerol--serine O-phosphatidyltransferase
MIRKSIPHIFTLLNLFCGCIAIYLTFSHFFQSALVVVMLGVFFDFFDGFFARLLKVESDLGVQLDSLADMVTSGFVPGAVMYQLFIVSGARNIDYAFQINESSFVFTIAPLALIGFIIPLGAAFRLAKFNLISDKVPYFRGLPTPANALFIGALPLLINHPLMVNLKDYLLTPVGLSVVVLLSVYLMNTHWKMISLKGVDKSSLQEIIFLFVLLMIAVLMFLLLGLASFVGIIITYVILSLLKNVFRI